MRTRHWLLAFMLTCGLIRGANAHFLFVRIGPMSEGGRWAEVYFSDQAEAGDPKFVDKIAGTRLWVQTKPGEFRPLTIHKGVDRLRALVPSSGSIGVVGVCEYGVLARPNQTPSLLRHYPKAVAGQPDDLNRLAPRPEVPFEITAAIEGEHVRLVALRNGKPVPSAVFHAVDGDLTEATFTARGDGAASWKPPAAGHYSIYTRETLRQPGDFRGTHYDQVMEFATLAFAWPLARKDADAEAVSMFEAALAARAQWVDFPGFTAAVKGDIVGREFSGNVTVQSDGTVTAEVNEPIAKSWLEDQLGSIALHRIAESDEGATGSHPRPVLRFGDDESEHPLGRLLLFQGGQFASSYRVKDRQITVVNRHIGRQNMTITILDNERNHDGRFLPRGYLVHYWDAMTGALNRVETIQERWKRVDAFDLPVAHAVTTSSNSGLATRTLTLSDLKLLGVK